MSVGKFSIALAILWILAMGALTVELPRFREFYQDNGMLLPVATLWVLTPAAGLWTVLGILAAAAIIAKDGFVSRPAALRWNIAGAVVLVLVLAAVLTALFLPMQTL